MRIDISAQDMLICHSLTKIIRIYRLQTIRQNITLNCSGKLITLDKPLVMGIINATPDSFHINSRTNTDNALYIAEGMISAGAGILDIGGYSSRPGAIEISLQEELDRVIPIIEKIHASFPETPLSIDTFRAKVAAESIASGASMVNDISSGDDDPEMMSTVAKSNVPYVMMHKKGSPQTMQENPTYKNVVLEVLHYFSEKLKIAQDIGIKDIIIDPGFGFGKTIAHNYELLNALPDFAFLEKPVLVGISRKSMIQKVLKTDTEHALNGTTVLHTIALSKGAKILRVHDVKEAVECIKIMNALNGEFE